MQELKPIIIIGAGGLGREVAWLLEDINKAKPEWDLIGFLDDSKEGQTVEAYMILGKINKIYTLNPSPYVVIAIADTQARFKLATDLMANNIKLATLIHPSLIKSDYVKIDEGSIICSGNIFTTNVSIGKHCIINPGCFIGHDTVLEDFVSLMPSANIAGDVKVGIGAYFGLSSSVINKISIGAWSVIGAGAVVINDIPDNVTVVGVPAKVIK